MTEAEAPTEIEKLTRDLKDAARSLSIDEARYLVDLYYQTQEQRKAADNQVRSMADEPHSTLLHFAGQFRTIEGQIQRALTAWQRDDPVAQWAQSIPGIGPVLSAGLLAHIDITKAPTVGHIWRYAGLDPTVTWGKGQKRPWNARLKVLSWKIGESFTKVSNRDGDIYGHIYAERKLLESERNERLEFADQAAHTLATKNIGKSTETYKAYAEGKLPQARIHLRAQRYATKLFLAHWHHVAYEVQHNEPPPKPYIIEHGGHTHYIAPPNWP